MYNTTREGNDQYCCPIGKRLIVNDLPNIPYPVSFCYGSAKLGEPCGGYNELCQSGLYCHADTHQCQDLQQQ
jgi:hypothetical protein